VAGSWLDLPQFAVWGVATLAGLALRSAAIKWNIALPSYREKHAKEFKAEAAADAATKQQDGAG
jgi:uncharacterized membrane protein YeiH